MALSILFPQARGSVSSSGNFVVTGTSGLGAKPTVALTMLLEVDDNQTPASQNTTLANLHEFLGSSSVSLSSAYYWAVLVKNLGNAFGQGKTYVLEFTATATVNNQSVTETSRIVVVANGATALMHPHDKS